MIAEFDKQILPGLVTLVIMADVLVIVLCSPTRSEREIRERKEAKERKKARSIDVLNVKSKGGRL